MATLRDRLAPVPQRVLNTCCVSLLIFPFFFLGSPSRAEEAPRRVLMLHAFSTFPATTEAANAARKRLLERSPQKIEIDANFLDLALFAGMLAPLRTGTSRWAKP